MEYCPDCGVAMKKTVWDDEAWGRMYKSIEWNCENLDCGEEQEEEDE